MEAVLFYFSSALAIVSSLLVIFLPKPTRALLALIVAMTALSILHILLGAYFLAISQIIVYAGAVLVLFLFVIMLQGIAARDIPLWKRFGAVFPVASALTVLMLLAFLGKAACGFTTSPAKGVMGDIHSVGISLFTNFLLPFELTSILLLLSIFAAVALAKKDDA